MEWTQEATIALIDAYKNKEILWDPKNTYHFNKSMKQEAWEELSNEIGRTVDDSKRKVDGLLSSFRRENMKIRKRAGQGKGKDIIYKSTWYAYDKIKFIMDKSKSRRTYFINKNDDDEECLELSEYVEVEEHAPPIASHPLPKTEPTENGKRQTQRENNERDTSFRPLSSHLSNKTDDDDSQHFGNLVAAKLRKYDEATRCALQTAIMGVFLNANGGHYDQIHFPKHEQTSDYIPVMHQSVQHNSQFPHTTDMCSPNIPTTSDSSVGPNSTVKLKQSPPASPSSSRSSGEELLCIDDGEEMK